MSKEDLMPIAGLSAFPKKEHDFSIYDILAHIRKRPGFYTIERSIYGLDSFLNGYELGLLQSGFTVRNQDDLMNFREWAVTRLGYANSTSGTANMIRNKCASDADAFEQFFVLLDEFRKESHEI